MDSVQAILDEIHPGIDYQNETALIDDGLLDSFNVIAIVTELNYRFNIKISVGDLNRENFNSMQAIQALVERHKQAEAGG
ncbi:MAG: acyl carrier protein [Bacillota bacterium]